MTKDTKLSPKRAENLSLIAFLIHLFAFSILFFLSGERYINSLAVRVEAWHFLGGVLIWLMLLIQFRQRRLADEELLESEEYRKLKREGREASVFEAGIVESSMELQAKRLEWMEKWLVPIFSLLTALYLLVTGGWLWLNRTGLEEVPVLPEGNLIYLVGFLLAGLALISFLFSQYAVGMSRETIWRPLRAGGSYLFSNSLASFALTVVILITNWGRLKPEQITSYVLIWVMIVIGAEMVMNLILDAFTPRMKGRYRRAPFESRLLGMFSEPGGIMRNMAYALDYQFGFKVSETWFYKLLDRTIVPLVIVQLIILYLMTSLTIVPTGHQGILERFGKPINLKQPFESGLHLKFPWLIDRVRTFPVNQIQVLEIGFERGGEEEVEKPLLWSEKHWKEEYPFMVAVSDSNRQSEELNIFDLLIVPLIVQYRINDVELYGYGDKMGYLDPQKLLEAIANQETLHYCATSNMDTLMGSGRNETTQALKEAIQRRSNEYELGVEIVFAGLETIHPPVEVAPAFEKVVGTLQEKQGKVLNAIGREYMLLEQAKAEEEVILAEAKAYAFERSALARANSERFRSQIEAYEAGRMGEDDGQNIYLLREFLSVLDENMPGLRKYVFGVDQVERWVYELDLKESMQPDLFEGLGLPEDNQGEQ